MTHPFPWNPTRAGMLPRLTLLAAAFLGLGGWLLWGRYAEPPAGLEYKVVQCWGIQGVQPGEINRPRAIQALEDGTLFVIDRSGRIQRFTPQGDYIAGWRFPDWQDGTPTSVSMDPEGRLVIANTHYSCVLVYEREGTLARQFGERGDAPGAMFLPTDAVAADDGTIFVLEREPWKDKVLVYGPGGVFQGEWGASGDGDGQFVRPMAITIAGDGTIWIADSCNHRLLAFDAKGSFIKAIGEYGKAAGQLNYPYDLALGPNGELVVAEYGNNRIQILDAEGRSLGLIGGPGVMPGEFGSPWGVEVGAQGTIWVADTLNNRIQGIEVRWP